MATGGSGHGRPERDERRRAKCRKVDGVCGCPGMSRREKGRSGGGEDDDPGGEGDESDAATQERETETVGSA